MINFTGHKNQNILQMFYMLSLIIDSKHCSDIKSLNPEMVYTMLSFPI
jgi:hypothetical protein